MALCKSPQPYLASSPGQGGGGREMGKVSAGDIEPETSQDIKPLEETKKTERPGNVIENKGSVLENLERPGNVYENTWT